MSHSYTFPILSYHVYTPTKIWNILNILLIAILPHIYFSPMFCYDISCIYTDRFWTILAAFSNVILTHIHIFPTLCHHYYCTPTHSENYKLYCQLYNCAIFILSPCYITKYSVYTATDLKYINCIIKCIIVLYSCFPHVMSLIILYINLHIVKYINCNIFTHSYFPHAFYYISCVYVYRLSNIYIYIYIYIYEKRQFQNPCFFLYAIHNMHM